MPLKDIAIRAAKPKAKEYKMADERGLYLAVTPAGSKIWRMKYRLHDLEKKLTFGRFPQMSLKAARAARDAARVAIDLGDDPARQKQEKALAAKIGAANSFRDIGEEYLQKMVKEGKADVTVNKTRWLFGQMTPKLGKRPVSDIKAPELLAVLRKVESKGKRETAHRMRSLAGRIFRYAIATGIAENDPTFALRGALLTPQVRHLPAITDKKRLGELLRASETYSGHPATIIALQLTPHIFQRPGEVRHMKWEQIDLDKAVWTLPAALMKTRNAHFVPLSRQSIALIKQMRRLAGNSEYVFPASGRPKRPMSENTVVGAIRRMGFASDEMCAHGYRTTASTMLNETGLWNTDAIERALSHADKDQIRGIYNRSQYWDERVRMAQYWSDYLDTLRDGGEVIRFPVEEGKSA